MSLMKSRCGEAERLVKLTAAVTRRTTRPAPTADQCLLRGGFSTALATIIGLGLRV